MKVITYNTSIDTLNRTFEFKTSLMNNGHECKIISPVTNNETFKTLFPKATELGQLWRPYIIKEQLAMMDDGSMLIYMDDVCIIKCCKSLENIFYNLPTRQIIHKQTNDDHKEFVQSIDAEYTDNGKLSTPNILGIYVSPETRQFVDDWYQLSQEVDKSYLGSIAAFSKLISASSFEGGEEFTDSIYVGHIKTYYNYPKWAQGDVLFVDDCEWAVGDWYTTPTTDTYDVLVFQDIVGRDLMKKVIDKLPSLKSGGRVVFTNYITNEHGGPQSYGDTIGNCKFACDAFRLMHLDLIASTTISVQQEMVIDFKC